MSVRLLTTALLLLLPASGQKPADLPQPVTINCVPSEGVLDSSNGTLVDLLVQSKETRTDSLLFGTGINSDAGVCGNLASEERKWVQVEDRSQDDVFPLQRLSNEWLDEINLMNFNQPTKQARWDCREIGMSMLRHVCPPLRLCPVCQAEPDPCIELVGCVLRECGWTLSKAVVQAQSPCNQGCPYYHPRTYPSYSCPEDDACQGPEEECQESKPSVEADDCSCCNDSCECESKCACTKDADCSCCNDQCGCAKAKCACKDCGKDGKCGCADGKCGCKDGACTCAKSVKVKKACGECCQVKFEKKCACKDCAKDGKCGCADGKCGCKDGACTCAKSVKVKKACGDCGKTFKTKFEKKCGCKDCKEGKCACGDCGCQDGDCTCGKGSKVKKACGDCGKTFKTKFEKKCSCKDCKEGKCACGDCGCQDGACTCKASKVKKACGDCGKTFKTKFEKKCSCKDCKDGKCACGDCGCQDGACTCKASKVKKACGDCGKTFKTKFEKKCACKDCKDGKCACGDCGCQDGACTCADTRLKKAFGDDCCKMSKAKLKLRMHAMSHVVAACDKAAKAEKKCACKDCVDCQCASGDCGCQDGACTCAKPEVQYECPHLKAQQAQAKAKDAVPTITEATPLENLMRITHARALCAKAEKLHQAGAHEMAEKCYRKAQQLAPGSRYDGVAQTALAAIEKDKAHAKLSLLDKARLALKNGQYDEAYQLAEQAYGEAYSTMSQANSLLRVIDAERFTIDPGVEESEPCGPCEQEPLPCEPQGCVMGSGVPIAVEVQVAECLEAAQRALTAGCFQEALTFADMALRLDPRCGAALYLADKAKQMVSCVEEQEEPADDCYPESGEEPCEVDPEAPSAGLYPALPPIDPAIAAVMHRLMLEAKEREAVAGAAEEQEPRDWQILDLYIDPEECDGYAPAQQGSEAPEPPLADAGALFRQLVQAVSGGHCIEVDTGKQGPRVWIQLGAAHCHWSVKGAGTISFAPACSEGTDEGLEHPCLGGEQASACQQVKVAVGGPCEVSIHIKWGGSGFASETKAVDTRALQEAHERKVLRWIESMKRGDGSPCQMPLEEYTDFHPCD